MKTLYRTLMLLFLPVLLLACRSAASYETEGDGFMAQRKYADALQAYNEAVQRDNKNPRLYHARGLAYYYLGDDAAALSDLSYAIRLDDQFTRAYYARALAYQAVGRLDAAVKDLNQAIILDAEYANAYYARGLLQRNLGALDLAKADLERYLELSENPDPQASLILAELGGG